MKLRVFIIMLMLISHSRSLISAEDNASVDKVTSLRSVYQRSLEKIHSDALAQSMEWSNGYKKALLDFQDARQKAGDLDGWRSAKDELERFNSGRTLVSQDLLEKPEPLRAIQEKYLNLVSTNTDDIRKKILALTDNYCAYLLARQTELTKSGNMEEAIIFNDELKRVQASETYIDAKGQAEHDVSKEPGTMPAEEKTPVADKADVGDKQPAGADGFRIYKQSDRTAGVQKLGSFKPLIMRSTGLTGISSAFSCGVLYDKAVVPPLSICLRGEGAQKTGDCLMRLALKTTRSDALFRDITLFIQYYAKGNVGQEKIPVYECGSQLLVIPLIDKEQLNIDCPPFPVSTDPARSALGYSSIAVSLDLYGVLISLFDSNKNLLYQAASQNSLSEFGGKAQALIDRTSSKKKIDEMKAAYEQALARRVAGTIDSSEFKAIRYEFREAVEDFNKKFPDDPYDVPVP